MKAQKNSGKKIKVCLSEDFSGGAVVENLPVNAGEGTRVRALVRKDPTRRGAAKPVCHNY